MSNETSVDSILNQLSDLDKQRRRLIMQLHECESNAQHLKDNLDKKQAELENLHTQESELKREVEQLARDNQELSKKALESGSLLDRAQAEEPVLLEHATGAAQQARHLRDEWAGEKANIETFALSWGGDQAVTILQVEIKQAEAELEHLKAKEIDLLEKQRNRQQEAAAKACQPTHHITHDSPRRTMSLTKIEHEIEQKESAINE